MTTPAPKAFNDTLVKKVKEIVDELHKEQRENSLSNIDETALRQLTSIMIKTCVAKIKAGEMNDPVSKTILTETETAIFADTFLRCMDLELFEIQIWRSLGSNY